MNEARAPTDENVREQVLAEYRNGVKPKALSEKTGISVNTIKSWIKRDKARSKNAQEDAPQNKKGASPKRKRGAPAGNKNAAEAGAPKGNQNAMKHGGYSAIYWDSLSEEEKEMIEGIPKGEEELLIEQIQLFAIRERRLMHAIKQQKETKGGLYVSGVISFEDKRKFKTQEEERMYTEAIMKKVKSGDRLPGTKYTTQTSTSSTVDLITRLEKELTSVQSKKTKAIDSLTRLRLEKQKMAGEAAGSDAVRLWAEKVKEMRGGVNG